MDIYPKGVLVMALNLLKQDWGIDLSLLKGNPPSLLIIPQSGEPGLKMFHKKTTGGLIPHL